MPYGTTRGRVVEGSLLNIVCTIVPRVSLLIYAEPERPTCPSDDSSTYITLFQLLLYISYVCGLQIV